MIVGKALVIDDEKDVLTYLNTFFEDNNFVVVCGENGKEGLKKATSEKPDIIRYANAGRIRRQVAAGPSVFFSVCQT